METNQTPLAMRVALTLFGVGLVLLLYTFSGPADSVSIPILGTGIGFMAMALGMCINYGQ